MAGEADGDEIQKQLSLCEKRHLTKTPMTKRSHTDKRTELKFIKLFHKTETNYMVVSYLKSETKGSKDKPWEIFV